MQDLNAKLALTDDLESFLEEVLSQLVQVLGSAHGAVMLIDDEDPAETINCAAFIGNGRPLRGEAKRAADIDLVPLDERHRAFLAHIGSFDDGMLTCSDDLLFLPGTKAYFVRWGIQSICHMAMRIGGSVIGWVSLAYMDRHKPDVQRLARMRLLTDQMAVAVEVSRLGMRARDAAVFERRQAAAQQRLVQLARANRSLKKSLDAIAEDTSMERVLGHMMRVIADQVGSQSAALCLCDDSLGHLEIFVAIVDGCLHLDDVPRSIPPGFLGDVSRVERALMITKGPVTIKVSDRTREEHSGREKPVEGTVTTLFGVPLMQGEKLLGGLVFEFSDHQAFSAEEIEVLQTHCHQIALALRLTRASAVVEEESRRAAVLAERSRLARELHDTLAQGLTGILRHLQASQRADDSPRSRVHIDAALVGAKDVFADARRVIEALDADSVGRDSRDFPQRLAGVLHVTFAESNVVLVIENQWSGKCHIDATIENDLIRIIQEAAINTLKHAFAKRFYVSIGDTKSSLRILIEDDGIGFDQLQECFHRDGFGLVGMRERCAELGGTFQIESVLGVGTRITIESIRPSGQDIPSIDRAHEVARAGVARHDYS